MAEVYVAARRDYLLRNQNVDGGWGYFPGKGSWLEPTAYAVLALHGDDRASGAVRRALPLIEGWQLPDGSWRAGAQVKDGTWVTALALTVCAVESNLGEAYKRGVGYLLDTAGAETRTFVRLLRRLGIGDIEVDPSHAGWPWRSGTSAWVEPTAHALIALKKAQSLIKDNRIAARIREGEQMILSRRCRDGGWNYGAPSALRMDLPSYPETTALAILGLQGVHNARPALEKARHLLESADWALARAWLTIALRVWGENIPARPPSEAPKRDTLGNALEALAHPDGNHRLLRTGG